ncbi:uncharacterized protein CTHT_0045350 [Thermochaetoides thermophila DSM 1495]|uniref:Uncharacterized protein n=1 Tax=Chaetomium thermophilum (strain DSM 1495 / CBS 144.50 / IMI 039719) TaxID=759272 RepID=G0S9C6_CHATD|nr:hypothetical protein CTHT_0045350 [Thermochaetoides thermophila DSM 1495]EGS20037.1 hypothetical protein CTHT_0045350 [Thermochaetoides thermophila DSM 1495]
MSSPSSVTQGSLRRRARVVNRSRQGQQPSASAASGNTETTLTANSTGATSVTKAGDRAAVDLPAASVQPESPVDVQSSTDTNVGAASSSRRPLPTIENDYIPQWGRELWHQRARERARAEELRRGKWSDESKTMLLAYLAKGYTIHEIADFEKRTPEECYREAHKIGKIYNDKALLNKLEAIKGNLEVTDDDEEGNGKNYWEVHGVSPGPNRGPGVA